MTTSKKVEVTVAFTEEQYEVLQKHILPNAKQTINKWAEEWLVAALDGSLDEFYGDKPTTHDEEASINQSSELHCESGWLHLSLFLHHQLIIT